MVLVCYGAEFIPKGVSFSQYTWKYGQYKQNIFINLYWPRPMEFIRSIVIIHVLLFFFLPEWWFFLLLNNRKMIFNTNPEAYCEKKFMAVSN